MLTISAPWMCVFGWRALKVTAQRIEVEEYGEEMKPIGKCSSEWKEANEY